MDLSSVQAEPLSLKLVTGRHHLVADVPVPARIIPVVVFDKSVKKRPRPQDDASAFGRPAGQPQLQFPY
jgi:hypothetical protein